MNRIVKYGLIAFLAWWAIKVPAQAGHEVSHLAGFLTHAAGSLSTLISSI